MKLYHGSTIDIAKVDLDLSKPNKDFGRAFYLSDDRQQALEMAQFRAEFEETEPVVNVYEFDETLFQEFRYKRFEAYTEEWAHFVYDHRTEARTDAPRLRHRLRPHCQRPRRRADRPLQAGLHHLRRVPAPHPVHQGHHLPIRLLHPAGY